MIRIRVSASAKDGRENFGSAGASCEVEFEVTDSTPAEEVEGLRDRWQSWCRAAVEAELAAARSAGAAEPPRPAAAPAPAGKPRSEWGSADKGEAARRTDGRTHRAPAGGRDDEAPQTGRALIARLKDLDEAHDYGVVKHVSGWAKQRGIEGRMVEWGRDEVKAGWDEARRYLEALAESDRLQAARN